MHKILFNKILKGKKKFNLSYNKILISINLFT